VPTPTRPPRGVHANANAGGPVIDILQVEEEIGRKKENAVLQGIAL